MDSSLLENLKLFGFFFPKLKSFSLIPVGLEVLNPETPGPDSRAGWSHCFFLALKRNVFSLYLQVMKFHSLNVHV